MGKGMDPLYIYRPGIWAFDIFHFSDDAELIGKVVARENRV